MAAAKLPVRRVQDGTFTGDQMQRQAQMASTVLRALPFAQGLWVKSVAIGTTNTTVNHGLGRVPQGYIFTRLQGNAASICESLAANQPADRTKQYAFIASAAVTADIWFF